MNPIDKLNALKEKIAEIRRLKVALSQTDYKIIKAYEYQMAGLEPPYDIETLHAEREKIREEIRRQEK